LGSGSYGDVFIFERKDDKKKVAVKIMRKKKMQEDVLEVVKDELSILAMLDH
jgi:serine/threonine protein kinase